MKNAIIIILASLLAISCSKDQDLNKVEETIYVRSQGADMPVYLYGNMASKKVILMVHGGPGGNGIEYRSGNYTVELESNYGVAYWDQRGQGMSQGHFKNADINIETMVNDLNAVVSSMKAKYGTDLKVIVLGHSWGGTLSAKYMITKSLQHNLAGWIEADGAHDIPKLNKDAISMFKIIGQEQIDLGNNASNWQEILNWANAVDTNNITNEIGGEINQNAHRAEEWLMEDGILSDLDKGGNTTSSFFGQVNPITSSIIGGQTSKELEEVEQLSMTADLNKVTIPTLILWGKYDFVVPPSLGYDTYNEISSTNRKIVIFEKSGHSPMSHEWQKFANEIIKFVDGL